MAMPNNGQGSVRIYSQIRSAPRLRNSSIPPLIFPCNSCVLLWVLKFSVENLWSMRTLPWLRLSSRPSVRLVGPAFPGLDVLRHGAPHPRRPRKWVGGLASARPQSRSGRCYPSGVLPSHSVRLTPSRAQARDPGC